MGNHRRNRIKKKNRCKGTEKGREQKIKEGGRAELEVVTLSHTFLWTPCGVHMESRFTPPPVQGVNRNWLRSLHGLHLESTDTSIKTSYKSM